MVLVYHPPEGLLMHAVRHTTPVLLAALLCFGACGPGEEPGTEQANDMSTSMVDMSLPSDRDADMDQLVPDDGGDMDDGPLEPNGDEDGDGLTNQQEIDGWMISVDRIGLGNALPELVTSDPRKADSDDDGLTDQQEFQRTDPNKPDTDGDGLSDADEVNVYLSIATSVDTDGDSISGATSNSQLWDGEEINKWGTSPSLADTDGDNRTDFEEIISNATNPLVAQVPLVDVAFEGNIDIALDVTYQDAQIEDQSYSISLASGQSTSRSRTNGTAVTNSVENTTTIGIEVESGLPPSATVSLERSRTTGYSNETSSSLSAEEGRTAQREYNRLFNNSQQYTETASTGSLSMGMVISNPSEIAYTLTNLTVSVFMWDVDNNEFRTVGTMVPSGLDELNFAPGGSTDSPIQVSAENLNVDLIREFMRNPKSLVFSVSNFDMQNSEGLNFVFLDEVTQSRTGRVIVDYGDGRVDDARVATNVRRNADGSLAGVKLSTVFEEYLEIPIETAPWSSDRAMGPLADKVGVQVLTKVKDLENQADGPDRGFWVVFSDIADLDGTYKDFGETVLQRGETLYIAYLRDRDGDGVYDREEDFHQSSDEMEDSDGDMLTDFEEVKEGWIAGTGINANGYPRQVYSTPSSEDADDDGFTDFAERMAGTDPSNPDTDADGIPDGADPNPLDDANEGPVITLTQTLDDPVVSLSGVVSDPVDAIDSVVIDWGDGFMDTLTSGYSMIGLTHAYLVPGSYTITVTATDARAASTMQTFMVTTTSPYAYSHYTMDNGLLLDALGNHNGTMLNASNFGQLQQEDRFGMPGSAIRFEDGFDTSSWAHGIVSNLGNIELSDFSIAFWNRGGNGGKVMMHQPDRLRIIKDNGDNVCVQFGNAFGSTPVCSNASTSGDWNFFVVSGDGTNLRIYVNGVLAVTTPYTLPGNISNCSEFHFNGELGCGSTSPSGSGDEDKFSSNLVLDDVRFFDRVISASDVATLYGERGYMP